MLFAAHAFSGAFPKGIIVFDRGRLFQSHPSWEWLGFRSASIPPGGENHACMHHLTAGSR